jgi:ferritin
MLYICNIKQKQNKMKKFNSYVSLTNELIEKRNLKYSPQLFSEILEEVKNTPKYVKLIKESYKKIQENQPKQKDYLCSLMSNHLTTDNRLK